MLRGLVMTRAKSMPLVNQMVATPSDWRERAMPSQEKVSRTRKVTTRRSQESGGEASRRVESDVDCWAAALKVVLISIDYSYSIFCCQGWRGNDSRSEGTFRRFWVSRYRSDWVQREAIDCCADDNFFIHSRVAEGGLVDALETVDELLSKGFTGFGPEEAAADAAIFFDREGEG